MKRKPRSSSISKYFRIANDAISRRIIAAPSTMNVRQVSLIYLSVKPGEQILGVQIVGSVEQPGLELERI